MRGSFVKATSFFISILFIFSTGMIAAVQFPDGVKQAAVPFPDDRSPQIIEGNPVEPDQWPFVVHVYGNSRYNPCIGTLIAPDWVLTAGHCVDNVTDDGISTVLNMAPVRDARGPNGSTCNMDFSSTGCGPFTRTERIIVHPLYSYTETPILPDVALIEVDWHLFDYHNDGTPSGLIRPLPVRILNSEEEARYAPTGTPAIQVGQRHNEGRGLRWTGGNLLRSAAECRVNSDWGSPINEYATCVGFSNLTRVGDSGGPVLVPLPDGTHSQVAIHNLGAGYETRLYPPVATRTAAVYDWISEYVTFPDWRVPQETHFPFFATGRGWTTEFVLMNPFESDAIEVEMAFFGRLGAAIDPVPAASPFTIPAGGTFSVILPDSTALSLGSAVATTKGSIQGFSRFMSSGAAWLGASGTTVMDPSHSFQMAFQALIGARQTYIGVRNPSTLDRVRARVSLRSAGGMALSEKNISVGPNAMYFDGLHTVFPAYHTNGQQFTGSIIIESLNDLPLSLGVFEVGPGVFNGVPVSSTDDEFAVR